MPSDLRHLQIEQRQVGLLALDQLHRRRSVHRLADDFNVVEAAQHRQQERTRRPLVIGDHHPQTVSHALLAIGRTISARVSSAVANERQAWRRRRTDGGGGHRDSPARTPRLRPRAMSRSVTRAPLFADGDGQIVSIRAALDQPPGRRSGSWRCRA